MPKIKDTVELYPFGHNCQQLKGEVSEETKQYLIESGKANEDDFEQVTEVLTKKKTTKK